MLNKGNLHSDGRALGFYLLHPAENEKVWLHAARGFLTDIEALPSLELQRAALMDELGAIDAIAMDATKAQRPFFHHYCRMPLKEDLNVQQWEWIADMIEARTGLQGQPRAIAFHVKDGYKHMHVAYSRISPDLKAIDMPFFIERMMAVSRQLEREWGLEILHSLRAQDRPGAPKRDEFEEARRLGVSIEDARQFILDCRQHADCGRAYVAALEEGGMILARGDQRPYVVVDAAGGLHSLDKSVLGITTPNIKKWLADLDHASLPTVDEARALQAARRERERNDGRTKSGDGAPTGEGNSDDGRARYAVLREEHARAVATNRITPEDYFDRDAAARAWDAGLVEAAIQHDAQVGARKAREAALPEHPASELSHGAGEIRLAFSLTEDAVSLAQGLNERGYTFARVTHDDIVERDRMALITLYQSQDAWMLQAGGALNLSEEHRASAERSYAKWRDKHLAMHADSTPGRQREPFAFANYVDYVQGKWRDELRRFGGYEKLAELGATEPLRSLVPRNVDAGDLVAVSQHGYAYRFDRHSTGLNEDHFKARIAGIDMQTVPTFEEATTRAFMDKTVRRMEKGRSARLKLVASSANQAEQLTERDPSYAHYRDDKLAAKYVQLDLAAARYGNEALRAVAARQMALARDGDTIMLCSPRYKFKPDPLMQEKIADLLRDEIAALPSVKEAKRAAWIAERAVTLQRDVRAAFRQGMARPNAGQKFVDALTTRGYELQRDQKQMLYVKAGRQRKLLTDLLDADQQRTLIPQLEDIAVYSQLMEFDNPNPRRTPEEIADYAQHEARAQAVIAKLAQPDIASSQLGEALGIHAVAFGHDDEKRKTYVVTERYRFELTTEQTARLLQVLHEDKLRYDPAAPPVLVGQLPDMKQAYRIASGFQRDKTIQRDVSDALTTVQRTGGGGLEFAARLETKDLELVTDYGNRLFVDTGKRQLALHDLVPLAENIAHLQFAREEFKSLRKFRSAIDVAEAHTARWDDINAARAARANAFVIQQAQHVTAQTVDRALFQADRAKTVAGIGMSFVGRALGLFTGGIAGLFADFGKYGQSAQPTVARAVSAPMQIEPEPGRLMRDRLARHSALEIAQEIGLRSQALSNSGMIGDDKRLEIARRLREAEERNRSRSR